MKIIDLLNKIAKGEEVPKKIAIQNDVLIYNEDEILNLQDCYYMADEEDATWKIWAYELNDEVEIIEEETEEIIEVCGSLFTKSEYDKLAYSEEEKKIPEKIDNLIGYDIQQFDDLKEYVEITTNDLFGKVNKVIDKVNQVIDYLKSKGE